MSSNPLASDGPLGAYCSCHSCYTLLLQRSSWIECPGLQRWAVAFVKKMEGNGAGSCFRQMEKKLMPFI